ncbi:GNAT family N-acetyltransferase [Solibacillus isronensis]|uniref:GNAT family N-acetyltransferase n=1 Tax=Solibacillus isronensis TaxID=412383 RepID=UPI00203C1DFC|nr:GNAT family N-acetyltransferase [Solibacillus isronensis]MCM3723168.1 GNAT family N-acetyltransferase [Solibacillus isronensis]
MIASGFLGNERYEVYLLDETRIPELITLQQEVVDALPDKAILQPLDNEELSFILSGNGLMIGVFIEGKLIAFRALLEPMIDEEHLGYDIGLKTEDELRKVLYQEISNVHPGYRGYRLQRTMADIIMQQVDESKFNTVCATVMPGNIASLKDKFSQHMHIAALKLKYGGKLRYVFKKSLPYKAYEWTEEQFVPMDNTEAQQQLLKSGFIGISMRADGADWFIQYVK